MTVASPSRARIPAGSTSPRRPPSRRPVGPARRAVAVSAGLVLAAAAVVGGGAAAVWITAGPGAAPAEVAVGTPVSVAGLDFTVEEFSRRRDAVAGSNTEKLPLTGPGMAMGSSGALSAGPAGSGGQSGQGGQSGHGGSAMPGMAGMLHAGEERVDVEVVIRNGDEDAHSLAAADFVLESGDRPVELLQETVSDITEAEMPPGSTLAGTITFVIPAGTAPLHLRYGDGGTRIVLDGGTAPASPDGPAPQRGPAGGHGGGHG